MKKYGEILKEIIELINKDRQLYQENELAYLTITSKIENPLRDKIAFELQKKLEKKVVCREWTNNGLTKKKADLAILDNKANPECIIEFKAHSGITGIGQWAAQLIKDIEKNQSLYKDTTLIFVLFANFMDKLPKKESFDFNHSIKYSKSISKAIKRAYTKEEQINDWHQSLTRKKIESKESFVEIYAGQYQGENIYINTFIHEDIKIDE